VNKGRRRALDSQDNEAAGGAAMFHLVVVVCVTTNACETVRVPHAYPTEARCAGQAAIVAGMVHGRHRSTRPFTYEYTCTVNPKAVVPKGQVAAK